jgi:putative aldouronate transport system permease protein
MDLRHNSAVINEQSKTKKTRKGVKGFIEGIKNTKYLQLLALPGLIYYVVFHYIPMYGILMAFQKYNLKKGIWGSQWIGFDNFIKFFNHPNFWRIIRNTVLLNVYHLLFVFPVAIVFALLLNEIKNKYYKGAVQTISYLPHFISMPAIIGILYMFLSPTNGPLNMFLQRVFGMEPIYFAGDPKWFRTLYIGSDIWVQTGWSAIIYIAALSGVDQEMYEAATLDGATRFQQMRYISIPSIQSTIIILFLLALGKIMSLGADKVILMQGTSTLTYNTSEVISTFIYRRGLENGEFSFTTAVGIFNSVINFALLFFSNKISRKLSETSLW